MKKIIDAGVNLTDKMYKGVYNGKMKHSNDIKQVLNRGFQAGIDKMILLGGSLSDCKEAVELLDLDERLYATIGCHPTNCNEYQKFGEKYTEDILELIENTSKIVAIGECGLDYDREQFCARDIQLEYFDKQLQIAVKTQLPLYLHCRAAHKDFIEMIGKYRETLRSELPGLVHTFDGSLEDGLTLIKMGFMLGVNGCSLKTEEQLKIIRQLPLDRLIVETDAPWCEVRPSHAGYKFIKSFGKSVKKEKWSDDCLVKSRNEPVNIIHILDILCSIRNESEEEIYGQVYSNAQTLFFSKFS